MQGNEGPQGQTLENVAGPGAVKFFMWDIKETSDFWQLVGGTPRGSPDSPQGKKMKAQRAKMKGKEGPKGHGHPAL